MAIILLQLIHFLLLTSLVTTATATCAQLEKYFLLSHACDFYFEGYFNFPPSLQLTHNTTYPYSILARDGTSIDSIEEVASCKMFTPSAFSFTGKQDKCPLTFTINNKQQLVASSGSQEQEHELLSTIEASVIIIYLNKLSLNDHSLLLTAGDGNTRFLESRRCTAFVRLPDLDATIKAMRSVSSQFESFGSRVADEFLKTMKEVENSLRKALGHSSFDDDDPLSASLPFGIFYP